jgi:hypothetical protein
MDKVMKAHFLRIDRSDESVHVTVRSGTKKLFDVFLPTPLSISAVSHETDVVEKIGDFAEEDSSNEHS